MDQSTSFEYLCPRPDKVRRDQKIAHLLGGDDFKRLYSQFHSRWIYLRHMRLQLRTKKILQTFLCLWAHLATSSEHLNPLIRRSLRLGFHKSRCHPKLNSENSCLGPQNYTFKSMTDQQGNQKLDVLQFILQ